MKVMINTFSRWFHCVRSLAMKKYFGCLLLAGAASAVSAQTQIDLRKQARVVDFSGALSTRPFRTGAALPVTCLLGETFFETSAAPVIGVYVCTAPNTWVVLGPGGAPLISSFANALHDHQSAVGGSVLSASAIGGNSKHGTGATFQMFGGGSVVTNDCAKFDAIGNVISAGAPCGSGSGGAVSAVFGRSGAITAQLGDYSFSQLSGTLPNTQIAAGIDAIKIGSGSVGNTAFGYVANLTSDVQAQLNGKAATAHSHTMAGDVTGDIATASVVKIQNRTLSPAAPANGQVLTWNAASSNWEPQTAAGGTGNNALQIQGRNVSPAAPADGQALVWTAVGSTWQPAAVGGGSGASASSQLTDLQVTLTNATTLTIAAACSAAAPCNVRFGNTVYSIVSGATVTLTGITAGTAYIYIGSNGAITVGHNLNLVCSNCTAVPSVIAFPPDAIPLWSWTTSSGVWDATGGRDRRAFLSVKPILSGTGIVTTDSGGSTAIAVDTATIGSYSSGAGAPAGNCSIGQVYFRTDNTFYVCATPNVWTLLGAGGGGAVASVFGRTGAVAALTGDYTAAQVTNALALSSGAGAPAALCTAGLAWYLDTTNQDVWFCSVANTWKKVVSTTNVGTYVSEGQTGASPSTPATGLLREYYDSAAKVPQAVDDAGAKSTMVRMASAPANQFATGFNASGVEQFGQPSFANLSGTATPAQLASAVNAQTTTPYTVLSSDNGKLVTLTNAGAFAVTLPIATGAFGSGWFTDFENRGVGTVTITPTTSTIDGAASLALTTNQGARVFSDGTNYFTQRGMGGAGGGSGTINSGTTDGIAYYSGATTLSSTSAGVAGQVLTSNGPGVAPTYQAAGGGSTGCYFTASQACVEDEFLSGNFTTSTIGSLGWTTSVAGSGQVFAAINGPFAGHPGTVELQAFSAADDIIMALKPSAATSLHLFSETWQMTWIFHQENVDGTTPTNATARVGSVDVTAPSGSPQNGCSGSANGVWIESLAADTDYFLVSCAAGVADTRLDTGVAKGTGWPKAIIKRVDATTVGVSMNGGNVNCITSSATAPAACTGTNLVSATHLPAGTIKQDPFAFLIPTAIGEKHLTIDYFQLLITGLTR